MTEDEPAEQENTYPVTIELYSKTIERLETKKPADQSWDEFVNMIYDAYVKSLHFLQIMNSESYLHNNSTICEICGRSTDRENEGSNFEDVQISHDFGQRWDMDHNSESFNARICGECFRDKIYPFLKALGVKSEYEGTSDAY